MRLQTRLRRLLRLVPAAVPVPAGVADVTAALLVPERHRIWHADRLWDLGDFDGGALRVVLTLVDGDERLELPVAYDDVVQALDTRPESDAVDSVTRVGRT